MTYEFKYFLTFLKKLMIKRPFTIRDFHPIDNAHAGRTKKSCKPVACSFQGGHISIFMPVITADRSQRNALYEVENIFRIILRFNFTKPVKIITVIFLTVIF